MPQADDFLDQVEPSLGEDNPIMETAPFVKVVFEHADRITVMKTGRVVGTRRTVETSHEEILRMIVTGSMQPTPPSEPTGRQTLRAVG